MKKIALALLVLMPVALLAGMAISLNAQESPEPAVRSSHLLDRGSAVKAGGPDKGGTAPPTGPTPIFYPPASPAAAPAPPGFGLMGSASFPPFGGAFLGNLFLPIVPGYPATFLTAGAVSGFDVTGAYAWHLAGTPAASLARVLGAAAVVPTTVTTLAAATVAPAFAIVTPSTGTPAPSGLVGGPGLFAPPVRVTAPGVGIFCGLAVGAPGFPPIGAGPAGNGLGGILGPVLPPVRSAMFPFTTGAPVVIAPAAPGAYIAGCFADSATTPVELQEFHID